MEVLEYLFGPVMVLLGHHFTVLGYTTSFFEIIFFGALISVTGAALYKLFGRGN